MYPRRRPYGTLMLGFKLGLLVLFIGVVVVLSINFVGGCGIIAILLLINLGGCSNMIAPSLMVEWFNTDCKLSVSLLELAQLFLEEGAAEGIRGDIALRRLAARCFPSRTTLQVLAPQATVQWGRAQGSDSALEGVCQ